MSEINQVSWITLVGGHFPAELVCSDEIDFYLFFGNAKYFSKKFMFLSAVAAS